MLEEKHANEVKKILAKYPPEHKQSAVMPLLHLVQREKGYVDRHAMREIADLTGITETDVAEIVGFYTLYHETPGGILRLQVCTDLSCALRGADEFIHQLCQRLGIEPGGTTADGMVTVEPVMCLAACDKAPMFQVQDSNGIEYHEHMNVDRAIEYIEGKRREVKK